MTMGEPAGMKLFGTLRLMVISTCLVLDHTGGSTKRSKSSHSSTIAAPSQASGDGAFRRVVLEMFVEPMRL